VRAGEGVRDNAGWLDLRSGCDAAALRDPGAARASTSAWPFDQIGRPGPIVGASGNVGPFAVQIAKSLGAEVTGVCSTGKVDFVRSLGADHVIDYKKVDYTSTGERYDWILDTDSHHSIFRVRNALGPDGVYITLGGEVGRLFQGLILGPLTSMRSDRWTGLMLWWKPFNAADVATLKDLIAAGKLAPAIDRQYPLSGVVEALRYVVEGHAKGKVVITITK